MGIEVNKTVLDDVLDSDRYDRREFGIFRPVADPIHFKRDRDGGR